PHFFFYCNSEHQDLPSFPTRRSSDLFGSAESAILTIKFWDDSSFMDFLLPESARIIVGTIDFEDGQMFYNPISDWTGSLGINSLDRKSTRLNSSHVKISYAVFCLKKK